MPIILDFETAGVGGPITCITVDTMEGVDKLDIPEGVKIVAVDRMTPTFQMPDYRDMVKRFDTMHAEALLDPMNLYRKNLEAATEAIGEFGKAVGGIDFSPGNYDGIVTAARMGAEKVAFDIETTLGTFGTSYHLDDPVWDDLAVLSRLTYHDPKPTDDPYDKYKPAEPHDRRMNEKRVARGRARNKAARKARRHAR